VLTDSRRIFLSACLISAFCLTMTGCGGSTGTGPDDGGGGDDQPGDRVYVDPGYVGEELGTREKPFNTIAEGIAATSRGDILVLAAGVYSPGGGVDVPRVIAIRGAGRDSSVVGGGFVVSAPADTKAVRVDLLACNYVTYSPTRSDVPPIVVDSCSVDTIGVGFPPDHHYAATNSELGGVGFYHGAGAPTHVIRSCVIERDVRFSHGEGAASNVVEDCTIGGVIQLASGSGATYSIVDNTVHGIVDKSGANYTTVSGNTLPSGSIVDKSGGFVVGQEDQVIEGNTIADGVIEATSASVTIRGNTITCSRDTVGIRALAGDPTNIIDNTVTVPYVAPAGEWWEWEHHAIRTSSGPGVVTGNTLQGGTCGILDASGASEISGNTISGAHVGIITAGLAEFADNVITGCTGDGMTVGPRVNGPFTGNAITDNGGAGVRIVRVVSSHSPDFGGGASGGAGGNTITGNADFDFLVETSADTMAVIFARHNTWDHSTESDVSEWDIHDGADDAGLTVVDFMPMAGGRD